MKLVFIEILLSASPSESHTKDGLMNNEERAESDSMVDNDGDTTHNNNGSSALSDPGSHHRNSHAAHISKVVSRSSKTSDEENSHGHHKLHPMLSLFYFSPVAAAALLPLQVFTELDHLAHSKFVQQPELWLTITLLLAGRRSEQKNPSLRRPTDV